MKTSERLVSAARWALFAPVVLIQAGAYLEGEVLTAVTGTLLALFLTVHQHTVSGKLRVGYRFPLLGLVTLFLTGSYIDAKFV